MHIRRRRARRGLLGSSLVVQLNWHGIYGWAKPFTKRSYFA
jgi:hypothetical protein